MAEKEEIIITPPGLHLLCTMCHYGYFDGFYNKSIYFTDGFKGDRQYLFQALGNMGATPTRQIDEDVTMVIIGAKIMDGTENSLYVLFVDTFQELLNQKNSPYRKILFINEKHLITRIERRIDNFNDTGIAILLKKYKDSIKTGQTDLYALFDPESCKNFEK